MAVVQTLRRRTALCHVDLLQPFEAQAAKEALPTVKACNRALCTSAWTIDCELDRASCGIRQSIVQSPALALWLGRKSKQSCQRQV